LSSIFSYKHNNLDIHPVRLNLSARISQPFSSVFLSQQINISISISRSAVFLQPAEQGEHGRYNPA
jgi:hypothetical protein